MKKTIFLLLAIILFATGCQFFGKKKTPSMDVLNEEGNYIYRNEDLGFSLTLPKEFLYYQTQREAGENFVDLMIYVPTTDYEYNQPVPGYGNPVTVRVYEKAKWQEKGNEEFKKVTENENKIYLIKFWDRPADWLEKWNPDVERAIIAGFKLI